MPTWAPQRERIVLNVMDYGANPHDSGTGADNVTAFNAALAAVPTAFPTRGAEIHIPAGTYRFNAAITVPSTSVFPTRFVGLANFSANANDAGAKLKCNTTSMTLLTFDGGASVQQQGPQFYNLAFDGASNATTTLVSLKMTNRARFNNCSFARATTGISFDSAVDTISGGDSSWHEVNGCHFYRNTTSIECRHSYGLNIVGSDFVHNSAGTGVRIGTVGTNTPSQHIRCIGTKFDGCSIAVDIEGGYCEFLGTAMESCTTGYKLRHLITNAIAGSKSNFIACGFGTVTTAFDIGSGCAQNAIVGANFTSVTNDYTFEDATARANTTIVGTGSSQPGNLRLATLANAAPADADLVAGQMQVWFDSTAGAAKLMVKGKNASGTVVTGNVALS